MTRTQRSEDWIIRGWLLVAACLGGFSASARAGLDTPIVLTQAPRANKELSDERNSNTLVRTDWFEGARVVVVSQEGQVRVLSDGFASACDPNVSFDAEHVLFAGKKEGQSRWRIWEIGLDGQGLHPVSPENQDARSPIYVSTLFTLDSPKPWFTIVYAGRELHAAASSLYNIKLDGTELRRLTFNPHNSFDPFQMWDGRVIYAAEWYPTEPGKRGAHVGLYGIDIEGTEVEFYGGDQGRRIQEMPCATEKGLVVFVEADEAAFDGAGQLACIGERRPHLTYRRLTDDPAHVYLYPSPWRGNRLLVSRRSAHGKGECGVFCFDADNGRCEPVFDSSAYRNVQAQAIQFRARPDGRSTAVDPKETKGTFYALNCYDADETLRPHLRAGMFKRVRVIEGVTDSTSQRGKASSSFGPIVRRRLIGEAPIEADGSFNVDVPANTPLLLQALDERGLALSTCGWVWVKPKEYRGCVGCHEDPELIPENRYVLALRRPSSQVTAPLAQRRTVAFRNDIVPILKSRCASAECHGAQDSLLYLPLNAETPAAQDLRESYAALLTPVGPAGHNPEIFPQPGKFVDAGRARTSPLIWRLFGADTSRPWDRTDEEPTAAPQKIRLMPPAGKGGPLSDEEIRTFIEWIDLGAPWEAVTNAQASAASAKTLSVP
jgi:Hydrazine synthase alpha subunit middle domain